MRLSRGVVSLEGNEFNLLALARAPGTPGQHGPIHRESFGRIYPHKVSGAEVGTSQKRQGAFRGSEFLTLQRLLNENPFLQPHGSSKRR